MIATSTLYNQILAQANHSVEWKIAVNGVTYGEDKINWSIAGGDSRPRITKALFTGNAPEVGACVSNRFTCALFEASANIPRMAAVVPSYRLVYGAQKSEWIQKGVYYIDTRKPDKASGSLVLECYDAMLKADGESGKPYSELTAFTTWPQTMSSVATEICTIIGVQLDSRTAIQSYSLDYPNDLTMREVLGYIAAAHGGCFTMTDAGKLRLVTITGNGEGVNVGWSIKALSDPPALIAWSGVDMYYVDDQGYQSGDDTGRVLSCDCPWATQAIANAVFSIIDGESYQPFSASGVILDLAAELGDTIQIGGTGDYYTGTLSSCIFSVDTICDSASYCTIEAPGEEELDHEYPYTSYVDRSLKRKVTLGQNYYGTEITRENGLQIFRSDGKSDVTLNSDRMVFRGLIDGVMKDQIYFDPASGRYIFDGALGADAIFTDSLYAETGDVSELTVDRLSTSRRIRKYILGDTSDDNYIKIQDQYILFITGTLIVDIPILAENGDILTAEDGVPLFSEASGEISPAPPVQAVNRYNQPLYWMRQPVGHTADGYPLDADGVQIYATTDVTAYPVYVYAYTELVKASFAFDLLGENYIPTLTLGAGNEAGNSKGYIRKTENQLALWFLNTFGQNLGVYIGEYLDLVGLRKTTQLDFSNWDNGSFSETIDGSIISDYTVEFNNGVPVKITDSVGHETVVVW